MSMEKNLNKFLEELIQEVEKELDEATATGNVAGYNVPGAFSNGGAKDKKRKKKISTQFGMKIVGKMDEDSVNEVKYYITRNQGRGRGKSLVSGYDLKKDKKLPPKEFRTFKDAEKEIKRLKNTERGIPGGGSSYFVTDKKMNRLKESVNEGYSKHFTYDEVVKSIVDFAKSKGYKIPSKGLDIIKGNPPSGPIRGWSRGTSIPLDKKINLSFDIYGVGKVFTVNQRLKLNKTFAESVNEAKVKRPVNRWLALKNDESMHAHKKMAMGLKELKYQLRETEKFFNWYNKIKTMNELDSDNYWKRTNKHIYKIKERLINIARTIQEIEK